MAAGGIMPMEDLGAESAMQPLENRQHHAGNSRRRTRLRQAWGLALAALVTAAAMMAWQARVQPPVAVGVRDFGIVPYGSRQSLGPARWPTGSPFVLRFTLSRDAYALVFHVSGEGTPTLLFPENRLQAFEGGRSIQVPPEGTGQAWLLDDQPGREWFLLVGSRDVDLDLDALLRRVDAEADPQRAPEETAAALESLLREQIGAPEVLQIEVVSDEDVPATRPLARSSL